MKTRKIALLVLFLACLASARVAHARDVVGATNPQPRDQKWWQDRHESFNKRAKQGNVDLVFIGDSITQGWETEGREAWSKHFGQRNAMNLGISGDQTQHVLWRLDHGNVEGISPKLAVLMIGTNNSGQDPAGNIAMGVTAVVQKLREKLPHTKVLVLAIFPRGEKPNPQRDKINEANRTIAKLADGKNIYYLDIGPKFTSADGTISKEIMPDFLHFSPKGYEIWATAVEPQVGALMAKTN